MTVPAVPLDQLHTFLAVHRAGTITTAAQELQMAQPTVTAQIRALEQRLGRPLFERGPRGVTPTPAGDHLASRIAGPLDAVHDVLDGEFGGAGHELRRPVHLGGPADFVAAEVMRALADRTAEGLQVRVTFGVPDDLLPAVAQGRLDLAVSTVRPRTRGVTSVPLCDEEFVLVAAADVAERLGAPLTPEELLPALATVPLIAYAEDLPIFRRYWRAVLDIRLNRSPEVVVPDLRAVQAAVRAGGGASVLPEYLCRQDLAQGHLVTLCEPPRAPGNTLYLVRRAGRTPHAAAELVARTLADRLGSPGTT